MKETEITVEVFNDYSEIDNILKRNGFKNIGQFQLNDWYFSKLDNLENLSYEELMKNSFLVRQMINNDRTSIELCYKIKEFDGNNNVISEEKIHSQLIEIDNLIKIFKFSGLNNYCQVRNNSYIYKNGNIELAIQIIKDLGIFIEFEETEEMKDLIPNQKITQMYNIIKKLGLKIGSDFSCKKVDMLLHRN